TRRPISPASCRSNSGGGPGRVRVTLVRVAAHGPGHGGAPLGRRDGGTAGAAAQARRGDQVRGLFGRQCRRVGGLPSAARSSGGGTGGPALPPFLPPNWTVRSGKSSPPTRGLFWAVSWPWSPRRKSGSGTRPTRGHSASRSSTAATRRSPGSIRPASFWLTAPRPGRLLRRAGGDRHAGRREGVRPPGHGGASAGLGDGKARWPPAEGAGMAGLVGRGLQRRRQALALGRLRRHEGVGHGNGRTRPRSELPPVDPT